MFLSFGNGSGNAKIRLQEVRSGVKGENSEEEIVDRKFTSVASAWSACRSRWWLGNRHGPDEGRFILVGNPRQVRGDLADVVL
jgi:hypothetical protein